jgi:hypothetical protein
MHILWECPSVRDVWCMGSINVQKSSISSKDFLGVVEDMFRRCRMDELTKFAGIARRVWLRIGVGRTRPIRSTRTDPNRSAPKITDFQFYLSGTG